MNQWWKANGGPLALVVVGVTLAGFTTKYGWVLVALGVLTFLGLILYRRLPWEIRRRTSNSSGSVDPATSRPATEQDEWECQTTIPEDGTSIIFDLTRIPGVRIFERGLACDLRSRLHEIPIRAVLPRGGMTRNVRFTYPNDFTSGVSGPPSGQYDIALYEFTAEDEWRLLHAERQELTVPRPQPH
jgi:hypothetical protein